MIAIDGGDIEIAVRRSQPWSAVIAWEQSHPVGGQYEQERRCDDWKELPAPSPAVISHTWSSNSITYSMKFWNHVGRAHAAGCHD